MTIMSKTKNSDEVLAFIDKIYDAGKPYPSDAIKQAAGIMRKEEDMDKNEHLDENSMTDYELMLFRFKGNNLKRSTGTLADILGMDRKEFEDAVRRGMSEEVRMIQQCKNERSKTLISINDIILVTDKTDREYGYMLVFEDYLALIRSIVKNKETEKIVINDLYKTKDDPSHQAVLLETDRRTINAAFCPDKDTLELFFMGGECAHRMNQRNGKWIFDPDKCSKECLDIIRKNFPDISDAEIEFRKEFQMEQADKIKNKTDITDMVLVIEKCNEEESGYMLTLADYLDKIKSVSDNTEEEASAIADLYETKMKPFYRAVLLSLSNHTIDAAFAHDDTLNIFIQGGARSSEAGYGHGNWKLSLDKCSDVCRDILLERYPQLSETSPDFTKMILTVRNFGKQQFGSLKSLGQCVIRFAKKSDTVDEVSQTTLDLFATKNETDLKNVFNNSCESGVRMAFCPDENTLRKFINGYYQTPGMKWNFDVHECSAEYENLYYMYAEKSKEG